MGVGPVTFSNAGPTSNGEGAIISGNGSTKGIKNNSIVEDMFSAVALPGKKQVTGSVDVQNVVSKPTSGLLSVEATDLKKGDMIRNHMCSDKSSQLTKLQFQIARFQF